MASPAAQKYFDAQSPEDQTAIKASWGGGDLMDEWYKNAVDDGAVPGVKKGDYTTVPAAAAPGAGGTWTPAQIRAHFQSMASSTSGTGKNDTFDNIDDNTIQTWINNGLWDQQNKRFKPERKSSDGAEIDYTKQPDFKPSDCPAGYTPNGSGPNALCTPNSEFDPVTGAHRPGGGGAGAAGGAAPAGAGPGAQSLQGYLTALMNNRANIFGRDQNGGYAAQPLSGGGIMWSPLNQGNARSNPGGDLGATYVPTGGAQTGGAEPKDTSVQTGGADPYGGYNPSANTGNAALTSATLNAFSPTNAPSASSASPTAQALVPPSTPVTPPATPFAAPGGAQPGSAGPTSWGEIAGESANPLTAAVNRKYNPLQNQWWNQAQAR